MKGGARQADNGLATEKVLINKNIKSMVGVMLIVVLCVFGMAGCGASDSQTDDTGTSAEISADADGAADDSSAQAYQQEEVKEFSADELLSGKHHVEMDISENGTSLGTIKLELDADQAPVSVTNFIQLSKDGFYNGLTFHRVLTGALIQGGDPNGDGTGGPGYRIKGEFAENGVENNISHVRGAISMARTSDYDGGGCQFFIMSSDCTEYDGQYAAFGNVTEGMDIVDKICNETAVEDWNGTVAKENQPVITEVRVID